MKFTWLSGFVLCCIECCFNDLILSNVWWVLSILSLGYVWIWLYMHEVDIEMEMNCFWIVKWARMWVGAPKCQMGYELWLYLNLTRGTRSLACLCACISHAREHRPCQGWQHAEGACCEFKCTHHHVRAWGLVKHVHTLNNLHTWGKACHA